MRLYNSLTGKMEEFKPIKENEVSMYVCGPTVYNYIHIGNARPMVVFDVLRRVFEYQGYHVTHMSNYTDVDDKIIQAAAAEGVPEQEITAKYIEAYDGIRNQLHVLRPNHTPKVTETMDEIIAFIASLVERGFAYEVDGDVYFRVNKIDDYGQLSKQNIEDLQVGARIDENKKKESPLDFTLWKATEEGIRWSSPWSMGRPGWHTECVVMINDEFAEGRIDIHGGGMDLKFPHHENEIAQSIAMHDHPIANFWMHNAMLNIDGDKMSKSLGNVRWAKDMVEVYGANVVRWMLLNTHYRSPLNITEEVLANAETELQKLNAPLKQVMVKAQLADVPEELMNCKEEIDAMKPFMDAMQDDLNIANAMVVIYETAKQLNQSLRVKDIVFEKALKEAATLRKMLEILGILFPVIVLSAEDRAMYEAWNEAKAQKDFAKADEYRAALQEKGIL